MTKQANILNKYELKETAMSDNFDYNNFYKHELGSMIDILKEEIKNLHQRDTYTNIVHNQFQIEKKEKRCYEKILDELEKWLEEENKKTFIDIVSISAYEKVLNKIKELKGENK